MKHKGKIRLRAALLCGILCTAWFVQAACSRRAGRAVFLFPKFAMENYSEKNHIIPDPSMEVEDAGNRTVADYSVEDRTIPRYTSTNFRYPKEFNRTLAHYSDFQNMYQKEQSPAVPGLAYTRFTDSSSAQMVPQGICLAGEYMLITAYDKARRSNSVIYVMSGETDGNQRLLTVLELPERNHAGGIAFDGKHIWVARSTSGYVSAISYETLKKAASCGQQSFRLKAYDLNIYVGVTASFVTYYKGYLWVGTYRTYFDGPGSFAAYRISDITAKEKFGPEESFDSERNRVSQSLHPKVILEMPSYVQGAQFLERGKCVYLVLAASSGRYADSVIYVYQQDKQGQDMSLKLRNKYCFPPMVETLCSDGQTTYFLFESAATCYSTRQYQKCAYPVDRICGVRNRKLLEEEQGD